MAAAGLTSAAAIGLAAQWLFVDDTLRVRDVTVIGAQAADPLAIAAAAGVGGASLLTLDTAAAAERVGELAAVSSATVRLDWPRGVVIVVTEHRGWGYWQTGDERRVIDAAGRLVASARPPPEGAPTIIEIGPPGSGTAGVPDRDTVQLIDRMLSELTFDGLQVEPVAFLFRRDRGLTIVVTSGPQVVFGNSHSFEFKVASWGALLDHIERERLEIRELDLRFGPRLAMR